jgi:carbamoyl-phosphate synthase large subunit
MRTSQNSKSSAEFSGRRIVLVPVKKPERVLVIGSGPIIIGQAAEFDYAGTQALKALREEGIQSILVNSNPATIMTDTGQASVTYIEPLTVEVVQRIIARERPDGLLATLGGQTALNLAVALADAGVLDEFGVRLLGTPLETIRQAEDRALFKELLGRIGEPTPPGETVTTLAEAQAFARTVGYPIVVRPAFTLGGTGGGIAVDAATLAHIVETGLHASPIGQVLLEPYLSGWKEIEYEVMRDGADTCITVCNMENLDPMGVHTGDSIVVAPTQTLSDRDHQTLRSAAIHIIRALGIEGGCNIQFALHPRDGRYYVIEVNPRVSRSSALASKATGYPIARVAAKIAVGRRLDEITNKVTGRTSAAFEPALDYVVVKIPRWPFDKFPNADRRITTQMKATGEVMAIDRTFEAALQKAVRALEAEQHSLLWEPPDDGRDLSLATGERPSLDGCEQPLLTIPADDLRLWRLLAALRRDSSPEAIARLHEITGFDPFFLFKLRRLVLMEARLRREPLDRGLLRAAKRLGFADADIARLRGCDAEEIRRQRYAWNIRPVYKMVDTCAGEFAAATPYFYSTYEDENEAEPLGGKCAVVLGSGPIRIGQGIEFDYCCVRSALALHAAGWRSILINSNPETVSTDFDMSDRLYFEPLDEESIRDILDSEGQPPVITQFGGQTSINLAAPLEQRGVHLLGTSAEAIDLAEDRRRFDALLEQLEIPRPRGATARGPDEARRVAATIGYPLLVRPSYVLGGRAMAIVHSAAVLEQYLEQVMGQQNDHPVLLDRYLNGIEVEVDALCDGETVLIPGIMEHIERAGVHSGDSFAVYPPQRLASAVIATITHYTSTIARALGVRGLLNAQLIVSDGQVYVIEVNPRASRTVPFLSKVTGIPMIDIATRIALGERLQDQGYCEGLVPPRPLVAVKAPVFSMGKLPGAETALGPEMRSTGEVMGIDQHFLPALTKALLAAGIVLPPVGGRAFVSIADRDKPEARSLLRQLADHDYQFYATSGTARLLATEGIRAQVVGRIGQGDPTLLDLIRGRHVDVIINTTSGTSLGGQEFTDGLAIRRAAAESGIPCLTVLDTLRAVVSTLGRPLTYTIRPLAEYGTALGAMAPEAGSKYRT